MVLKYAQQPLCDCAGAQVDPGALLRTRHYAISTYEPLHDKTKKMICAPSEDLDQPGHLPSLIRVLACAK